MIDLLKTQIMSSSFHIRGHVSVKPPTAKAEASASVLQWTFTAEDASAWTDALNQESAPDEPNETLLKLSLIREGGAANTSDAN